MTTHDCCRSTLLEARTHRIRKKDREAEHDVTTLVRRMTVHPAAEVARDRSQEHADEGRYAHGHEPDLQRDPGAVEHAGEHVPAQLVGAEQVHGRRARKDVVHVDGARVVGSDERGYEGEDHQAEHYGEPCHCQPVAEEARPEAHSQPSLILGSAML